MARAPTSFKERWERILADEAELDRAMVEAKKMKREDELSTKMRQVLKEREKRKQWESLVAMMRERDKMHMEEIEERTKRHHKAMQEMIEETYWMNSRASQLEQRRKQRKRG